MPLHRRAEGMNSLGSSSCMLKERHVGSVGMKGSGQVRFLGCFGRRQGLTLPTTSFRSQRELGVGVSPELFNDRPLNVTNVFSVFECDFIIKML